MPVQKSKKPVQPAVKLATKVAAKTATKSPPAKVVVIKVAAKTAIKKPAKKVESVPLSKTPVKMTALQMQEAADALLKAGSAAKKKTGTPPQSGSQRVR